MTRPRLGPEAEAVARAHLEGRGLVVAGANVRTAGGELDIVAWDGEVLVFVEVKGRRGSRAGNSLEAVDVRKRQRLAMAAAAYLAELGRQPVCRFDVVGIDYGPGAPSVRHLRDAFRPGE